MSSVLNTAVATGQGYSAVPLAVRDVFSAEIYFTALPTLKFDQFSTKKTELGVQKGDTIKLPKYNNLKRGGYLEEGRPMKARSMSLNQASISIREVGNAVAVSERLLQTSFYDQLAAASLLLGRDMAVVLDEHLRDALLGSATASILYAGEASSRITLRTGMSLSTDLINRSTETLATNNSPMWGGDHYICFLHPHQAAGLRRDPLWVNMSLYAGSGQLYTGEIGRINDVRFVQTSVMPNGANDAVDPDTGDYVDIGFDPALELATAGNLTTIYQAVMFGEYAYGHATGMPVEIRDNGVVDFGREHGLAWYAMWGSADLEPQNIVIMETA
jgi:N4-gp56 family major capsid protein